jgi:tagatose 1,6-diphosphate aldolase GatY/KbaY
MIDRRVEALAQARAEGRALGAFSVYNLELSRAVCAAAEQLGVPLILQTGSSAFRYGGDALRALVIAAAQQSSASIGVHLDHSHDLEELRACLDAGYSSVMIDGSALPFAENVALTRAAVELAQSYGAWVEAELGGVAGDEDCSTGAAAADLTDPDAATRFVEETAVDALAVSIGNVHGFTAEPIHLDFDRLEAIGDRVAVPLVLHGASGLEPDAIRRCITLRVAKVNVNTELRVAFLGALRASLAASPGSDDLFALYRPAIAAVAAVVAEKQRLFTQAAAAERSIAS